MLATPNDGSLLHRLVLDFLQQTFAACFAQYVTVFVPATPSRKFKTKGCGKQPLFGDVGTKTVEYCARHALERMVDVNSRKYVTNGCGKLPSCGVASTKTGACHYLTNRFQMKAPVAPSRSLQEGSAKPSRSVSSRRLRGASKAPPRTLRGGLRTLRGGCTYRRLDEDALEGSRGLLEGSVDELHVPTQS